jgi:hypothetical protein
MAMGRRATTTVRRAHQEPSAYRELVMTSRHSVADLVARALDARRGGDALGENGLGLAVADSLATRFGISAGGHKVANLPRTISIEHAVGSLLALTDRALWLGLHVEELFTVSLYVAGPTGALDVYSLYCGPSGLALGAPSHLAPFHAFDPNEVARALAAALLRVAPLDWCVEADSDFGAHRMGSRGGQRITEKTPGPCVHVPAWEPGWLERSCAVLEAGDADLTSAWLDVAEARAVSIATTGISTGALLDRAARAAAQSWARALDRVEADLSAHPRDRPLSAITERAAKALAHPPSRALADAIGPDRTKRLVAIVEAHHAAALASG